MKMVKLSLHSMAVAGILMASQSPTSQASVADIVTPEFFNSITNEAHAKNFYTRAAFLDVLNSATTTPNSRSLPLSPISPTKLYMSYVVCHSLIMIHHDYLTSFNITCIYAHMHADFCYIEEINGASHDYCDETVTQYPCAPNKGYCGRGRGTSNMGPPERALGSMG